MSLCLWPNHSGKLVWGQIWIFVEVIFNSFNKTGFFRVMESNAVVTLQFKSLAVEKKIKDGCIRWWKISKCLIKFFDSWFFHFILWRQNVTVCDKGNFLPFLHTVIFSLENIYKRVDFVFFQRAVNKGWHGRPIPPPFKV